MPLIISVSPSNQRPVFFGKHWLPHYELFRSAAGARSILFTPPTQRFPQHIVVVLISVALPPTRKPLFLFCLFSAPWS